MFKKIFVPLLLVGTLLFINNHPVNASPLPRFIGVNVQLNGVPIDSDVSPYIDRTTNTTYVPLRVISEGLGASVSWNKEKQQVTIRSNNGTTILMTVGSRTVYVNNEERILPNAPEMPFVRVMVPLRFVSEVLGATIKVSIVDDITNVDISTKN
ncbi:copper amine oxidase N-terminal domain-containing protein [Paenibacillus sp. FSL W8-0194]|uniref:copper amine oxidase N-terminal domain-containing protein n=1 Tax=Paenibacillus sp. FSL W8-0194 TaxID=2921711 RepID=UPI0030DB8B39